MEQYINKAALVAEILNRVKKIATLDVGDCKELEAIYGAKCHALNSVLSFIDTLGMKEVDLEKETDRYFETMEVNEHENIFESTFQKIAKHFFELGLKAQKGEEV